MDGKHIQLLFMLISNTTFNLHLITVKSKSVIHCLFDFFFFSTCPWCPTRFILRLKQAVFGSVPLSARLSKSPISPNPKIMLSKNVTKKLVVWLYWHITLGNIRKSCASLTLAWHKAYIPAVWRLTLSFWLTGITFIYFYIIIWQLAHISFDFQTQ